MTSSELQSAVESIKPADDQWLERAQARQHKLTKPPGSLGQLEDVANRLCAMGRTVQPRVDHPRILVFAADHGVCAEGVNAFPQSVSRQMLANFAAGGAAINAFAFSVGARLIVVNVGVLGPPFPDPNILDRRVAPGTRNFCHEPAMSASETVAAIQVGIEVASDAIQQGSTLLALGEMGIGNTTAASALCAALTEQPAESVCGPGTGLDARGMARKQNAVRRALELHRPSMSSPARMLACLGGLEIAALCGVCLEAARRRTAVLLDGFITTAAAAIAVRWNPNVCHYLIASHLSCEPGHALLLKQLNLRPLLQLEMRLGEGSGAALAIPLVRASAAALASMASFESAGVSAALQG